ncbi:unnamed protein product, partial [Oppiella nova]
MIMDSHLKQLFSLINVFLIVIFISFDCVLNKTTDTDSHTADDHKTIAIIGCGVGGSSSAYFLNQLSKTDPSIAGLSVDLYDKSGEI